MIGSSMIRRGMIALAMFLSGCANVPREAGFGDVRDAVAERVGKRVHWNQGTDADREVAEAVRGMLGDELTADEAVQIALLNNRRLQATFEELMVAQADLVSAGLLRNPVFDAEVKFVEGGGGHALELSIVQDFIDVFFIPLRKRIAESAFESAKLRVVGAVMDLAAETRTAFYTLQASQQLLEMRHQVVTASEASFDVSNRLRAAGNITELELANERMLYEQAKLDLRSSEAQVPQDRERLNRLMGLWGPDTNWSAELRLPDLPADEVTAEDVERRAVERSLDLQAARQEVQSASRRLGLAPPLGFIPEAELGAAAEREPDGEWAVGPAFSLPIPLFDQGQPAVASARAQLRAARARYEATAVDLRSRVRAAYQALIAARDQVEYHRAVLLPLRQVIVEQSQLQYNAMQVGPLQLLLARQQQIEGGAAYIRSLRDYWIARAELDQLLLGRMSSFGVPPNPAQPSATPASARQGH